MRQTRMRLAALCAAIALAGCGGGGDGSQAPRVTFSSSVFFGDSLSDSGSYAVGTIAAVGGGKWTVNSPSMKSWPEIISAQAGTSVACPAQTGLLTNIPGLTGAAVVNNTSCTNYAQGSSRVSSPFGPNSAALQAAPFSQVNLGLMALPVSDQMDLHLTRNGGAYKGTELVAVMAGGNDAIVNLAGVGAAAGGGMGAVGAAMAAGWDGTVQAAVAGGGLAAVNAASTAAVTFMGAAGAELATRIKTQVVGKGAKYVVVINLPDLSTTPYLLEQSAQTQALVNTMVTTFNGQLRAGLEGTAGIVYVDAYTQGRDQIANPAQYSLTNVTDRACSKTSPANPLAGSSLACTAASTIAGDTSHYLFADDAHLTPLGYQLLAQFVAIQLAKAGWF